MRNLTASSRLRHSRNTCHQFTAEQLEVRTLLTVYTVNTIVDEPANGVGDTDGFISLREAIEAANTNSAFGDAPAGSSVETDSIIFDESLPTKVITLGGTQLIIADDLEISGPETTRFTIDANFLSRNFLTNDGVTFDVSNLIIQNGFLTGQNFAGGIRNRGNLTVTNSILQNNRSRDGGAIYTISRNNSASVTIKDSVIDGNTGGGVFVTDPDGFGATVFVDRVTFSNNEATFGGGIYLNNGSLDVFNSTFSDNGAKRNGGGIRVVNGSLNLVNSTVVNNRSDTDLAFGGEGAGVAVDTSTSTVSNTIIANNVNVLTSLPDDVSGTFDQGSFNIIGDPTTAGGLVDGTNGNQVGVNINDVIDTELRDNGGVSKTHALVPNSIALNRGNNALAIDQDMNPLSTDQRGIGFPRIIGNRVDIGAYEGFIYPLTSLVGFYNGNWWLASPDENGQYDHAVAATGPASTFQKVLTGDFNGDGHDDLAAWLFNGEWRVGLSDGNGNFTFSTWTTWTVPGIKEVHVGDFNDDGLDDIIGLFPIPGGNRGRWWVGMSDGTKFLNRSWGDFGNFSGVLDVAVGNFDGVKGDDLTIITATGNLFMVKTSNTQFQYLFSHNWVVSNGFDFFQAGDFNGDGRDDVVAVFGSGANKSIFVAKSTGPATGFASLKFSDLTATQSLDSFLVGDFNGDGKDDVAARLNTTKWWLGLAGINVFNFTFGTTWSFATNGVNDIQVGSTNDDANSDILGRDSNGNWISAESNGSSLTTRVFETWAPVNWQFVNGGDFLPQPTSLPASLPPAPSKQEADEEINPQLVSRWIGSEITVVPVEASTDDAATEFKVASDDRVLDQSYDRFGDASLLELLFSL